MTVVSPSAHPRLSFGLHEAGVEICESEVRYLAGPPERFLLDQGLSFDDTYAGPLPMIGVSVGAAGSGTVGTLGPFLGLTSGADVSQFKVIALTASHVVKPGTCLFPSNLCNRLTVLFVEDEHPSTSPQIGVVSPSDPDHAAWVEALGGGLPGVGSAGGTTLLDDLLAADPTHDQERLQQARGRDRRIGSVLATSGLTKKCPIDNCRLDWAVVDITSALGTVPSIPTNVRTSACTMTQQDVLSRIAKIPPPPLLDYLRQVGFNSAEGKARKAVFKLGRTTGPTVGLHHGCKAMARQYQSKVVESLEEVVIPVTNNTPRFAKEGDSGALVYGPEGKGLGMVWGGVLSKVPTTMAVERMVYVTPIRAIARDVAAQFEQAYSDGKAQWHWLE